MEQSKHVSPSERQIPRLAKFVILLDPIYCHFYQLFFNFGNLVTYTKINCLKIQSGFHVQIILY